MAALTKVCVMVCGNSQSNVDDSNNTNSIKNLTNNSNMFAQKITPSILVETTDARAVADYYLSIFKDSKLKDHHKYTNPSESGSGNFETAIIEIAGMDLSILTAGPFAKFNESGSFVINTKDQAETDYYWTALTSNGGQENSCGWCKDKYGLSWQVVPIEYYDLNNSPDPKVREKAIKNTLKQ
ncbi:MAG: 3-demethylubiquinone-9 3-methyltransferase [Bacteroidetes bacterium OLB9]|nr:MAG: 3-demethylubiquinone-9 3-methyltransferase [Bacteroidetes bacterium OLB9]